jgi:ribonuclease BN (tRNA processing enzyme)
MLEEDGRRLLLDCGPGVLARLRERWPWPEIDSIAVTHWHLDHWGDLVPWVWGQMLGPGEGTKKPELWIPPDGTEMLETIGSRLGRPDMFARTFDLHEYVDGESFETAGFTVTPVRVLHYEMLAFGFRASANGAVLAYSGDSGPSDALVQLAQDADLFVCEATLLAPNPEGGTRGHLASDEAVAAFEQAGAKRLLLTHRPFERPLDGSLELAHDGLELDV